MLKPSPLKPPTRMSPVDVKPVRVTTTLLNPATFAGVNMMVTLPVDEARELSRLTLKLIKPLAGMIGCKKPFVVVSSTAVADIVAAAMLNDELCATLGLMMFVQVNLVFLPAMSLPELNVTVSTPDAIVAVALGLLP